jgi:hypothetical protein
MVPCLRGCRGAVHGCCTLGSVCSQSTSQRTGDWAHGRRLYQMPSDAVGALRCAVQTMRAATSSRAALVLHHGENAACSALIHKAVSLSRTAILAPPGRPRLKHMRPIIPAGVEHGLKPAATSNLLPACVLHCGWLHGPRAQAPLACASPICPCVCARPCTRSLGVPGSARGSGSRAICVQMGQLRHTY